MTKTRASAPSGGLLFKTGSYVGTGAPNPISGVGFQPKFVYIYPAAVFIYAPVLREESQPLAYSFWVAGGTSTTTDAIPTFSADGFTVQGANTNALGTTYYYFAFG